MGRYAKDNRPHIKPVEKIQLSEDNTTRRIIAAALFLLLGAGALVYAFVQLFTPETGWQAIQTGTSDGPTCGDDFNFQYELGSGNQAPAAENRALSLLYTRACQTAYQLFHTEERFEGVVNLREINLRPNEALVVDEVLYRAFETVQKAGDRTVYLGPVYARYEDLFYCQDDAQLVDFDPRLSPEVAEEYAAITAYAADPAHIDVELLGDNQIRLRVSEDYLTYARQEGIDHFLDFGWMENAFIVDYLAETMISSGYTHGCITSIDGFARCLDDRDVGYGLNLLAQRESAPIQVGTMEYQGPMSLAGLRTFALGSGDERWFYRLRSGETRTLYLDPADGVCRSAADSVVGYSQVHSCAELAVEIAPVFVADKLDPAAARELVAQGIQLVVCREERIYTTDSDLTVTGLREGYTLTRP